MTVHALDYPPISDSTYEQTRHRRAHTVVLGYDGSRASRAAARHAGQLAGPGGRVVAVRAVTSSRGEDFGGLDESSVGPARLETRLAAGDAASAIAKAARECGADHVVIGCDPHGRSRILTMLLRSRVCPVVVVPPEAVRSGTR